MFRSFFLAGFEGSTGYNRHGDWFDQVVATGHDRTLDQDYRDLAAIGIYGAREAIRWPLVDLGRGRYDFSTVDPLVKAARRSRVEVIWDLFHYGYPRGLDPFSAEFRARFADYCYAVGRHLARTAEAPLVFTPVNEPSFLAFAGGEKGLFAPHVHGHGWDLKVALCRAAIAGIDALWAACSSPRMVNVDPVCRVAAHPERPHDASNVDQFNDEHVFQAWDILCGRLLPEFGGSPSHLDIVGINYYWTNQWEWGADAGADGRIPPLAEDDPRRLPLGDLVRLVWQRYGREVMVAETAHVGERRAAWVTEVAHASQGLLLEGVPLRGVCLYPILGMPEWHAPGQWTCMGLWDPVADKGPEVRTLHQPMLNALRSAAHVERLHRALNLPQSSWSRADVGVPRADQSPLPRPFSKSDRRIRGGAQPPIQPLAGPEGN